MAERQFYENNELTKYAEDMAGVNRWAAVSPMGTIIEMNGEDEFKVFMVNSNHEPKEL